MSNTVRFAVIAAAAAVALAGCSENSSPVARDVTVVGSGEVTGAPDILNADVGITTTAPDVSGAVDSANERAKAVIDAIVGAGVSRADVQTNELSIQPQMTMPLPGGTSSVGGYQATNSVRIVVRDLPKASGVLDAAVRAGGDSARLGNVSFAIDDKSKLLADARARAFDDAKARAQQYAQLAGLSLGDVATISENSSGAEPTPLQRSTDAASSSVPIEPGTQKVRFDVTVKWSLG